MNFQAFDIVSMEEIGTDYIWKAATALFSIYVFFVSERFLKFFLKAREVQTLPLFTKQALSRLLLPHTATAATDTVTNNNCYYC